MGESPPLISSARVNQWGARHEIKSLPTRRCVLETQPSATKADLQSGHVKLRQWSHPSKHRLWNTCRHSSFLTSSPSRSFDRHTTQSEPPPSPPHRYEKSRFRLS
ncbi:hypothetical protein DY000_02057641 [Brassica cretica]|uniref:Uncharacterized protein n=1 Tax=Brassica cretica TaxID=69181 RepID=A0ABQ7AEC4_BRACR|nr:hypothetical protein DY000_02057641 [Brassica cretica]